MDIVIEQGETFHILGTWRDEDGSLINLTNYTARMNVRKRKASVATLLTSGGTDPSIDISLGGAAGTIRIMVARPKTEGLDFIRAVYDLEMVRDDVVTRLVEGNIRLSKEVTR